MITVRPAAERGHFDHGWLKTWHSFSFASYHDPRHMGFSDLRVINQDIVEPGEGFGTHPHRDMEILTWVLDGALEHRDSMGNGSTIRPGEIQRMTAGTGVTHSEFNPSPAERVQLLQIWILPETQGLVPGYEQKTFPKETLRDRFRLVASRDGRDGSVVIHQDAELRIAAPEPGVKLRHEPSPGRRGWLQVARGAVTLNGTPLASGDGAAIGNEKSLTIEARTPSEVLLFDLR